MASQFNLSNLVLTGPSGVGKSTIIKSVGFGLVGRRIRGFYGDAIFDGDRRLGWRLDAFDGEGGTLAHVDLRSDRRMGPYGVDMDLLDRLVESQLRVDPTVDVYLVDEIGIIGAWSERFVRAVTELLDSRKVVVAILRYKKGEGFTERVRNRRDVILWDVTMDNRDEMAAQVLAWVDTALAGTGRRDGAKAGQPCQQ